MPSSEELLARLCVRVDTASADAELCAAGAARICDSQLASAGEALQAGASELLTGIPDERLARRVSRLAGALLKVSGRAARLPSVYSGLCAYGALAPRHHADELVRLYGSGAGAFALALPAVLAMPDVFDSLVPLMAAECTRAAGAGDEDTLCLAASAMIAVHEKSGESVAAATARVVREARTVARAAGMVDAHTELNNLLQLAAPP